MSDDEARKVLVWAIAGHPRVVGLAVLAHALQAIEDRAYLAEKLYPAPLPDGLLIELDHMRLRIKGEEQP